MAGASTLREEIPAADHPAGSRKASSHPAEATILLWPLNGHRHEARVREILAATGRYAIIADPAAAGPPDLIISILSQDQDPAVVLAELRAAAPGTPLLPILDKAHLPAALDPVPPGITDFLVAPARPAELLARVRRLLPMSLEEEIHRVRDGLSQAAALECLRGLDPAFEAVKRKALLVARADVPVLVTGETGTGKELTAQAIHYLSDRAGKPFLPVNCGGIPAELFENELFGHHRGAFTDARSPQAGLVAEAEGGTLLLDEIDALDPTTQVKLLRFLEDLSYRPLGTARPVRADVRIIAASNADLLQRVREGTFRTDLYYRLNVVRLHLPPLRDRGADLVLLAEHFLRKYGQDDARWGFAPDALAALQAHPWPGNVRELENAVRQVVILTPPHRIRAEDLPLPGRPSPLGAPAPTSWRAAKAAAVSQFERSYLEDLLRAHRGNITQAAQAARQDRRSFRRLIQKHGLNASVWARSA